jgi:hypothetical protein
MIQTIHQFFAFPAAMRPEDPNDRNRRDFKTGSNFNWRGIFLFVAFTSVILGLFLFSRNGNYGSVDRPAPRQCWCIGCGATIVPKRDVYEIPQDEGKGIERVQDRGR